MNERYFAIAEQLKNLFLPFRQKQFTQKVLFNNILNDASLKFCYK